LIDRIRMCVCMETSFSVPLWTTSLLSKYARNPDVKPLYPISNKNPPSHYSRPLSPLDTTSRPTM
jgi:hypothetical protein